MERITIREEWKDVLSGELFHYRYKDFNNNHINKLGQLEDIEEELGIDLIILFKALKDGIYAKVIIEGTFKKIVEITNEVIYLEKNKLVLKEELRKYIECNLDFKNYGLTWALTKEELE